MSIVQVTTGGTLRVRRPKFEDYFPDGSKQLKFLRNGMIPRDALKPHHVHSLLGLEDAKIQWKVDLMTKEIGRVKSSASAFFLSRQKHTMLRYARDVEMTLNDGITSVATFKEIGTCWSMNANWEEAEKVFHVIIGMFDLETEDTVAKTVNNFMMLENLEYVWTNADSETETKKGRAETSCLTKLCYARRNDCVGYITKRGMKLHGFYISRRMPREGDGKQHKRRQKGKFMREFVKRTDCESLELPNVNVNIEIDLDNMFGDAIDIASPNSPSLLRGIEDDDCELDSTRTMMDEGDAKQANKARVSILESVGGSLELENKEDATTPTMIPLPLVLKDQKVESENRQLKQRLLALERVHVVQDEKNLKETYDGATKKTQDKRVSYKQTKNLATTCTHIYSAYPF
jgi:hypothetical protein